MSEKLRILLAEDHKTVREGIKLLVNAQKDMGGYASRSVSLRGENKTTLTDRESEVLRLIALGYSNKEIAESMNLSVKTIETHKGNAMQKLGINSRIGIVRYAILQDWLHET